MASIDINDGRNLGDATMSIKVTESKAGFRLMDSKRMRPQWGRLGDRDFFYISATHAKALARLEYFVRQQWNFAMLLGTGGSGRSSTLRVFSQRLTWQTFAIATVDASIVSPTQFLWELARSWKVDCAPTADLPTLGAAIEQALQGFWYSRTCPLVMIDNIDFAPLDVQQTIMWIASSPAALAARIQFIMSAHPDHAEQLDPRIRDRIDLRVDLERWDMEEIREFLLAALPDVKNVDTLFTPDAIAGLQEASFGNGRKVRQLVRLALLAAESQGVQTIDERIVAVVRADLAE